MAIKRIYVGRLSCGCAVAATIDPDDVAEMARNGYSIETVDAEYVEISGCQCANTQSTVAVE
ncbi:MAG TPA: hypothetical protein VFX97_16690 [Pyrinomonadaceae bacterium]|nr:hypothetical protein [Pyrinomonadaceae bacterium]